VATIHVMYVERHGGYSMHLIFSTHISQPIDLTDVRSASCIAGTPFDCVTRTPVLLIKSLRHVLEKK
jgi:hypothetical protein